MAEERGHRCPRRCGMAITGLVQLSLLLGCGSRSSLPGEALPGVDQQGPADAAPARDGRARDLLSPAVDLGPSTRITGEHDSCERPGLIDLSPLGRGEQLAVLVDTAGAADDYHELPVESCAGLEDVVAQVINVDTAVEDHWDGIDVACHGGGEYTLGPVATHAWHITCSGLFFLPQLLPCDGSARRVVLGRDGDFLLFCRRAAQGPLHLTFSSNRE